MTLEEEDYATERPSEPVEPSRPISTRAGPPRPRRLSRRALALMGGGAAIAVAAALLFGLSSSGRHAAPQETVAIEHGQGADLLANAPRDYGGIVAQKAASLGPPPSAAQLPVPGTPGASGLPTSAANPRSSDDNAAAAAQRLRQQRDSAHASKLFSGSSEDSRSAEPINPVPASAAPPSSGPGADASAAPGTTDAQDRKAAFVASGLRMPTVNSGRLTEPAGLHVVVAGSTISAALVTGLSSDLPGEVIAQVTEDVLDSNTGHTKLIPQGTRLLGSYDAHVTYGQSRALVVWTRLILPDGRSLDLDRLIGTDAAGQSGFAGRTDRHTGQLLKAGLLSALFGLGTHLATSGGAKNDIASAIRDSAGQSIERAGDKLVSHQVDVQPTITVRPGTRVRVLVSRDLVLAPWAPSQG